jgi:hypothetical protein
MWCFSFKFFTAKGAEKETLRTQSISGVKAEKKEG